MNRFFFLLVIWGMIAVGTCAAQDSSRVYHTVRISKPPVIDGVLDEPEWQTVPVMENFYQFLPIEGSHSDHPMEVRLCYDNNAIYVGVMMYDSAPDSILRELGPRDASDINSDYFRIAFDPYVKHQDAYFFGVYASGVQFDNKFTDPTFDAVWESDVKITDKGWVAELRIPYSAIRFPKSTVQTWSFQVNRYVRRTRELTQWAKTPSKANNYLNYWATLEGINGVEVPLRLSFTPYLSGYLESSPVTNNEGNTTYSNSFSYNAGADVKYGIDERFTLDLTLLPDFGQVQSDKKVKNLSYREVTYDENRPFFKESIELFSQNNLFYSRRIGQLPSGYYSAQDQLQDGEFLTENPSRSKLLNAVKVSGRTDGGLGIGLFNAVTDNTYAVAEDSLGHTRKILTEPLINYNIVVFDQHLKNNSEVYFINTNVTRDKKGDDANVTGTGFSFSNKKNTFAIQGSGAVSQRFSVIENSAVRTFSDQVGYKYSLAARKLGGTFNYAIARTVYDNNYYTSDLGYQAINNRVIYEAYVNHNVTQPWKLFRNSYNNAGYTYATHFITGKPVINECYINLFGTFLNYLSAYVGGGFTPSGFYDYFEPRVEGRYHKSIRYLYSYYGFSTDYRKKLAFDMSFNTSNFIGRFVSEGYNVDSKLRYRFSDRLTMVLDFHYNTDPYNLGYVDVLDDETIIYGLRKIHTYIPQLSASYIFNSNMYVTLNARHYWSTARYRKYLTLEQDGDLTDNYMYDENNDFNYNAFNIDFLYSWQFAPGSNLSVVYKNAIENDETGITRTPAYDTNLKKVLRDPQTNSISLKVLYYFDYQYLRKKKATE